MELTSTYEGGEKWNPSNRLVPPQKSNPEVSVNSIFASPWTETNLLLPFAGPHRDCGSTGYLFRRDTPARVADLGVRF